MTPQEWAALDVGYGLRFTGGPNHSAPVYKVESIRVDLYTNASLTQLVASHTGQHGMMWLGGGESFGSGGNLDRLAPSGWNPTPPTSTGDYWMKVTLIDYAHNTITSDAVPFTVAA